MVFTMEIGDISLKGALDSDFCAKFLLHQMKECDVMDRNETILIHNKFIQKVNTVCAYLPRIRLRINLNGFEN